MNLRTLGPAVAGSWYPAGAEELRRAVDEMLDAASARPDASGLVALIEPHAGYCYSGSVAAKGFRAVRGRRFARVIVMGPSHYVGFRGAAVPDAGAFVTPLGHVPLDEEALSGLRDRPGFRTDNRAFGPEHSLEAEIPFLQRSLAPGWRLVPVLIGSGTTGAAGEGVATSLAPLLGDSTLVVVSSDFTHFGRGFGYVPFEDRLPERIQELDFGAVERIQAWDARGFEAYCAHTGATVCGRDAIGILLRMLPAATVELVAYDTSGRMTGDWSHTVSYAALAVRAAGNPSKP